MVPRHIKLFERMGDVRRVFCGTSFSLAVTDNDMLFMFGSNNPNANANMYPKPVHDLCGWNITSIGCSSTSIVISADDTLIGWGTSPTYGELVSSIEYLTRLSRDGGKKVCWLRC